MHIFHISRLVTVFTVRVGEHSFYVIIIIIIITRIWHVPAKHTNRMDARAHTSTLVECAARFDASFSGVCRPKFTKLGTRAEQPCALILPRSGVRVRGTENMQNFDIFWPTV